MSQKYSIIAQYFWDTKKKLIKRDTFPMKNVCISVFPCFPSEVMEKRLFMR